MPDSTDPEQPEGRPARSTWARAQDQRAGGVSAERVASPRDREAVEGEEPVVAGFTATGPTGSQGGRATHGVVPDREPRADDATEGS